MDEGTSRCSNRTPPPRRRQLLPSHSALFGRSIHSWEPGDRGCCTSSLPLPPFYLLLRAGAGGSPSSSPNYAPLGHPPTPPGVPSAHPRQGFPLLRTYVLGIAAQHHVAAGPAPLDVAHGGGDQGVLEEEEGAVVVKDEDMVFRGQELLVAMREQRGDRLADKMPAATECLEV